MSSHSIQSEIVLLGTYLSSAHVIRRYAANIGGMTYKNWLLNLRSVFSQPPCVQKCFEILIWFGDSL